MTDVVFMVPGGEPFGKAAFAAASKSVPELHIEGISDIVELQVTPPGGSPMTRSGYIPSPSGARSMTDAGAWQRDANLLA